MQAKVPQNPIELNVAINVRKCIKVLVCVDINQ